MLRMTDIKIELLTDIDMFKIIKKGMSGEVSYIANRYGVANNRYMKKNTMRRRPQSASCTWTLWLGYVPVPTYRWF